MTEPPIYRIASVETVARITGEHGRRGCPTCGHDWGPHAMVAPGGDPLGGGFYLCPEFACQCYGTWGIPPGVLPEHRQVPANEIPAAEHIHDLRVKLQAHAAGGGAADDD